MRHPERTNLLTIILDTVDDGRASCEKPRLHVVGIEDSVLQLVRDRLLHRESPAGPSATLRAITSLAMAGIGGPLRAGYLRRRLALETQGEFVFELACAGCKRDLRSRSASRKAERDGNSYPSVARSARLVEHRPLGRREFKEALNRAIEQTPKPAPQYDPSGNNVVPFRFRSTPRTVEELR